MSTYERRRRVPRYPGKPVAWHQIHLGSDYSAEELEFLRAIDQYKRVYQRPYPTWREVLHVFKSLGWRKVPTTDGGVTGPSPPRHSRGGEGCGERVNEE